MVTLYLQEFIFPSMLLGQGVCRTFETLRANHLSLKTLKAMHYLTNFLENFEKGNTF